MVYRRGGADFNWTWLYVSSIWNLWDEVTSCEDLRADLGAKGETVPKETELVFRLAEVGAAWLSPKSGTTVRYCPGVSWLIQPDDKN